MSVLSKEDFMASIKARVGDDTSDEAIKFIEDMTDTYDEMEKNEGEDWKKKYEENDEMWRNKYTSRFYSSDSDSENKEVEKESESEKEVRTYEDLFKTD